MTAPVVCIVDDDEYVRKALRRLVDSAGLRAELFASPEEFLARPADVPIDCLVLDVRLPGMDGFELRSRAAEAGIDAPVIFITAHADPRTRARAARADAVAFLAKPFDEASLLEALEAAVDRIRGGEGKTPER